MLPHALEMALEEADGFRDEPLLRRANVSPFFSSCKAATPIQPAEFALTPPVYRHATATTASNAMAIAPLNIELCGDSEFDDGKTLSRVSSWCDFSLDSESPSFSRVPGHASPTTLLTGSVDAWDLFLEGKTPSGGAVTYALKTPTAQNMPAFPAFYGDEPPSSTPHASGDPTALSPTHMDKKVLVTDSDLKLDAAVGHQVSTPWAETNARPQSFTRARSTREKLFPQDARPRRALMSKDQADHRFRPYAAASPRRLHVPGRGESAPATMPRLPALSYAPYCESPSVFPLVDRHWRRPQPLLSQQQPPQGEGDKKHSRPSPVDTAFTPMEYAAIFRAGFTSHHRNATPTATRSGPKPRKASKRKIGIYSPEARRERIRRFHEKRKQRVFHKRVKYDCRKLIANACPRVKGRFVRKDEFAAAVAAQKAQREDHEEDTDGSAEVAAPSEAVAVNAE